MPSADAFAGHQCTGCCRSTSSRRGGCCQPANGWNRQKWVAAQPVINVLVEIHLISFLQVSQLPLASVWMICVACAYCDWALSRAGVLITRDNRSRRRPAGLKCICIVHCNCSTRCCMPCPSMARLPKWEIHSGIMIFIIEGNKAHTTSKC